MFANHSRLLKRVPARWSYLRNKYDQYCFHTTTPWIMLNIPVPIHPNQTTSGSPRSTITVPLCVWDSVNPLILYQRSNGTSCIVFNIECIRKTLQNRRLYRAIAFPKMTKMASCSVIHLLPIRSSSVVSLSPTCCSDPRSLLELQLRHRCFYIGRPLKRS